MKPVRLLCFMFLLAFLVTISLNLLSNRNMALIYSVTIIEYDSNSY